MPLSDADARLAQDGHDRLATLQSDLRDLVEDAEDAQLRATFETAAEAVGGLAEAFSDIVEGEEEAWDED